MDYCEYETDFLSADEEFELRYADEMEVLHEMQQDGLSFLSSIKIDVYLVMTDVYNHCNFYVLFRHVAR